jgi:hypothetical protein
MKKIMTTIAGVMLVFSAFSMTGCTDGVRQAITPYVISGLGDIADGLLQGLSEAIYPEGTTNTSTNSSSKN